jgi:hypothetical protein
MFEGSVEPLDLDFAVLIADEFSPAARSARIADFAREQLAAAQATNAAALGFVPAHQTVVDGAAGISEDHVRPDGVIVYTFELLGESLYWIMEQLRAHAPVGETGNYRESITLYADGVETDAALPIPAEKYVFLSGVPYARKIEGDDGRRPQSSQAPDGVFEAVAAMAAHRFGNQMMVKFSFISPDAGGIVDWARTENASALARRVRGGSAAKHHSWLTRVPAVIVTLRG